jgi:hypothetical protein
MLPTCKIIDRHCERSEAIQSPCSALWIASSASPPRKKLRENILQDGHSDPTRRKKFSRSPAVSSRAVDRFGRCGTRNDESMILQVGIMAPHYAFEPCAEASTPLRRSRTWRRQAPHGGACRCPPQTGRPGNGVRTRRARSPAGPRIEAPTRSRGRSAPAHDGT